MLSKKDDLDFQLQIKLNALRTEARNTEEWLSRTRDTIDEIQDLIFQRKEGKKDEKILWYK